VASKKPDFPRDLITLDRFERWFSPTKYKPFGKGTTVDQVTAKEYKSKPETNWKEVSDGKSD